MLRCDEVSEFDDDADGGFLWMGSVGRREGRRGCRGRVSRGSGSALRCACVGCWGGLL